KEKGISSKRLEDFGLEYRYLNRFLENKIDFKQMKEKLFKEIVKYAKRQMTWFKNKIKDIHWLSNKTLIIKFVKQWLTK
ncbi:MAG: tRNA (adenosine(37)-N6)-dimethylallyltransferase MiaA, partial [Minisyncoccia bacterium]